ncbi:MAG: hypothetical protein H3Z53_04195 [archaeon]|nr:hypothetical protein [archaeon]MCP8313559.1 hypothetical protein [archaeon]
MQAYLQELYIGLEEKYKGSLVSVKHVKNIEPNAKEYLNKLARQGLIEKVTWGWYWILDEIKDVWDFLSRDKNFKIVSAQTAASFWNYDFIHRNVYLLKVADRSYGRALKEFAKKRGWNIELEYVKSEGASYRRIGKLLVEDIEDNIINCIQRWAFTDAFATLYTNRKKLDLVSLEKKAYWKRIAKSNVRVKQALEYGYSIVNRLTGKRLFPVNQPNLKDELIKREIEEAIEKVIELA